MSVGMPAWTGMVGGCREAPVHGSQVAPTSPIACWMVMTCGAPVPTVAVMEVKGEDVTGESVTAVEPATPPTVIFKSSAPPLVRRIPKITLSMLSAWNAFSVMSAPDDGSPSVLTWSFLEPALSPDGLSGKR